MSEYKFDFSSEYGRKESGASYLPESPRYTQVVMKTHDGNPVVIFSILFDDCLKAHIDGWHTDPAFILFDTASFDPVHHFIMTIPRRWSSFDVLRFLAAAIDSRDIILKEKIYGAIREIRFTLARGTKYDLE